MYHKSLINLPVFSQSGDSLGKITGFEIDPDSQSILRYYVKPHKLIKALLSKQLIIHRSQVISIDEKKMIVEDAVGKEKIKEERPVWEEEKVKMPV
jgi:sporulation protein YlmC with PRC-barrel domain